MPTSAGGDNSVCTLGSLEPQGTEAVVPPVRLPQVAQYSVRFDRDATHDTQRAFPLVALPAALTRSTPRRRLHFIAGRYCAARALEALGVSPLRLPVWRGSNTAPEWPDRVVGSITHTDGFAWAAAARLMDIAALGVDSERIVGAGRARHIRSLVTHPSEMKLALEAVSEYPAAVTLLFSAKEAVFKCVYPLVRRYFGYRDAQMTFMNPDTGAFGVRLTSTLSSDFPAGRLIEGRFRRDGEFTHAAVCIRPAPRERRTWRDPRHAHLS